MASIGVGSEGEAWEEDDRGSKSGVEAPVDGKVVNVSCDCRRSISVSVSSDGKSGFLWLIKSLIQTFTDLYFVAEGPSSLLQQDRKLFSFFKGVSDSSQVNQHFMESALVYAATFIPNFTK